MIPHAGTPAGVREAGAPAGEAPGPAQAGMIFAVAAADDPERARLLRRGLVLEYLTLGWNVTGIIVLAAAAVSARSVALAGFGLDSLIERRPETRDRTRAIARHEIDALWDRRGVPLREKKLWRMLYESAARADSVLSLDIEDLNLPGKRGRTTAKGGVVRWIHWQSGTARLLPRLIAGRTSGPVFLSHRRPAPARTPAASDICPSTGTPGCPTSAPSTCSRRPLAAGPSTSSATSG